MVVVYLCCAIMPCDLMLKMWKAPRPLCILQVATSAAPGATDGRPLAGGGEGGTVPPPPADMQTSAVLAAVGDAAQASWTPGGAAAGGVIV